MNSKLIVNGYTLDLSDNISVPLNLSISDIREPEKRKRSFSKTLTLEGTSNNMAFFLSAYALEINIEESTNIQFTPNKRYDCEFFKNDLLIFRGKFKLNEVKINNGTYLFDCNLINDTVDIFAKLKDKKLSELYWSEYNHALTRANVISSWNENIYINGVATRNFGADTRGYQPKSQGYIYPIVDYGYVKPNNNSPLSFKINQLAPFIYVKEAVKKCLDFALEDTNIEVDYTTTFFENNNMKKLIYGYGGGEQIKLSNDIINGALVSVSNAIINYTQLQGVKTQPPNQFSNPYYSFGKIYNVIKNFNITTTPTEDLNIWNLSSGTIDINVAGKYTLNFAMTFKMYSTAKLIASPIPQNISISVNGLQKNSLTWSQKLNIFVTQSLTTELNLKAGDKVTIEFQLGVNLTANNLYIEVSDCDYSLIADNNQVLTDGSIVSLSAAIPDIKCSDFLKGILNLFYAYLSDPIYDAVTNKSLIYINSFINFYDLQENYDDWTNLVDESQDITIQSNSLVQGNVYTYKFSEEKDLLNTQYKDLVGINYGEKQLDVDTWLNGVVNFELPFNTYVPYKIENSSLIYPLVKEENKPYKGKGMLTFYNGLRSGGFNIYDCEDAGGTYTIKYDFPFIHHIRYQDNNNFDPLFDLHFGSRNATFDGLYNVPLNNTFNIYHEKFVNEITSIDSKLVTLYLKLSHKDINELDFAKLKMIDGVLYRLNQIKDFDSDAYGTTEVELIKFLG